jgi:hypothetical protein
LLVVFQGWAASLAPAARENAAYQTLHGGWLVTTRLTPAWPAPSIGSLTWKNSANNEASEKKNQGLFLYQGKPAAPDLSRAGRHNEADHASLARYLA